MTDSAHSLLWARLGALPEPGGVRFVLWSPEVRRVELLIEGGPGSAGDPIPLAPDVEGLHAALVPGAGAGTRYRYRVDGRGPFPDPASRYQPDGVHGASCVVDPEAYAWRDAAWRGRALRDLVLYELHVGAFTPAGTFRVAIEKLPHLVALGVTAIELMPLADFPGERNWGYDGAALFAPAHSYGTPDDLRAFVDAAHAAGLAVHLDVVYNHLGPDGAYVVALAPILDRANRTEWGTAVNLDGRHSPGVRELLIQNAIHWVREYHFDGLRLDATPALRDASPRHFVADLADRVRAAAPDRPVVVVAEDVRNDPIVLRDTARGGWGCDGVWSFDFHNQAHRMLSGEAGGYYVDHDDRAEDLARIVERGWLYDGAPSRYWKTPRGGDPTGIDPEQFVFYLQNHDEVGNRAGGERLHHLSDRGAWRAALAILLLAPQTPLLFMGQEWAASTPFLFFTDHPEKLGARVTESRREWLVRLAGEGVDPASIADWPPQDRATFEACVLRWDEREREPHAGALRLHRALLALRRMEAALQPGGRHRVHAVDEASHAAVLLARHREAPSPARDEMLIVAACLRGAGQVGLPGGREWQIVLDTEAAEFAADPSPASFEPSPDTAVTFARPGAVVLRGI